MLLGSASHGFARATLWLSVERAMSKIRLLTERREYCLKHSEHGTHLSPWHRRAGTTLFTLLLPRRAWNVEFRPARVNSRYNAGQLVRQPARDLCRDQLSSLALYPAFLVMLNFVCYLSELTTLSFFLFEYVVYLLKSKRRWHYEESCPSAN